MKIFYAVQATGNGHISRAFEILPYLKEYGEVDVFLSGSNYDLKSDLLVAYRNKGLSLCYNQKNGSIDIWKTLKNLQLKKIWRDAKYLPVEKYDLIINDFECITSLACKIKKLPSVHFGHQASFRSPLVPRPDKKDFAGELILSNYARGTKTVGLHFKKYDSFIFQPIIKQTITNCTPTNEGHITVYLSQYTTQYLVRIFQQFKKHTFHLFTNTVDAICIEKNVKLFPIHQGLFNQSLISCNGIITGGGFETPAEALYLGKKLMVIPIAGQYEQQCNVAALEKDFSVSSIQLIDDFFPVYFNKWIWDTPPSRLDLQNTTKEIVRHICTSIHEETCIPSNSGESTFTPHSLAIES